jgi:hypothetical protein
LDLENTVRKPLMLNVSMVGSSRGLLNIAFLVLKALTNITKIGNRATREKKVRIR